MLGTRDDDDGCRKHEGEKQKFAVSSAKHFRTTIYKKAREKKAISGGIVQRCFAFKFLLENSHIVCDAQLVNPAWV